MQLLATQLVARNWLLVSNKLGKNTVHKLMGERVD
jgi:hypothetical protein